MIIDVINTLNKLNPSIAEIERKFRTLSMDYSMAEKYHQEKEFKYYNVREGYLLLIDEIINNTNIPKIGIGPVSFFSKYDKNVGYMFGEINEQYCIGMSEGGGIAIYDIDTEEFLSLIADCEESLIKSLPLIHKIDVDFLYKNTLPSDTSLNELSNVLNVNSKNLLVELIIERYA